MPYLLRYPAWKLALWAGLPVALLMFALSTWLFQEPEAPKPPSRPALASLDVAPPQAVAASFLALLRLHDLEGAYGLLSASEKEKLTQEAFVSSGRAWLSDPDHRWDLRFREVGPVDGGARLARVSVLGKGETWSWVLVREDQGWRVADSSLF